MHSRILIFRALCVVGLTIVFFGAASAAASPHRVAVLQGLDKVTARVSTLSAPIGATVRADWRHRPRRADWRHGGSLAPYVAVFAFNNEVTYDCSLSS